MFAKMFEALYFKVLINIVVKRASTVVYIELYSKKKTIDTVHKEFETTKFNEDMLEFITNYTKESPYYYISLLDISSLQGALPTCSKNRLGYYYDLSDCEYRCYEGRWTYYTSKTELYDIEKKYKAIGVDFIFSPFVLLAKFFQDKINGTLAIYALIQENSISLCVFEEGSLIYADHLEIQASFSSDDILLSNDMDEDLELDLDSGIDLESIDVESEESELEDFGNIEDLDSIEDLDEFDDSKDIEEELLESNVSLEEAGDESFNEDYQRFTLIQNSIANFYKDERYESQFLENIYIADGVDVSSDLKKYLEEEMFLNVYVRHMELDAEVCEITKEELNI